MAIVTGAAGGIGLAACRALAADGAAVLAVDLAASVRAVVAEIPGQVQAFEVDVAADGGADEYVAAATHEFGGVDLFFNNAGILGPNQPWVETALEDFDAVMRVNVRGAWLGIRAVLPAMKARGGGAIVNACSMGGLVGFPDASPYIASKHAVLGLTKVAAIEGARHGVRVNAVCPGLIDTSMGKRVAADHGEGWDEWVAGVTPMGRTGTPEEVADAVCYLLSDQAGFINGSALSVDGGIVASG